MRARCAVAGGLAVFVALLWQPAAGQVGRGHLQAGPILLEIRPGASATRLVLGNTGDAPVAAQVRVFAWSQPDGDDRLQPSDEVAVSPPIVELPAGAEQIVRVVRLGAPPAGRDQTYRIVVDELPQAGPGRETTVDLRMRYVLPVFVRAPDASPPALACGLDEGAGALACDNRGGRAAQLGASRLLGADGGVLTLSDGLFGYVLPGSRRVWRLNDDRASLARPLTLETRLNGQPTTLDVGRLP